MWCGLGASNSVAIAHGLLALAQLFGAANQHFLVLSQSGGTLSAITLRAVSDLETDLISLLAFIKPLARST
jgi:hypothetical protein